MAMSSTTKKSNQFLMTVVVLLFLGWLVLIIWTLSLWFFQGFDYAFQQTTTLAHQQAKALPVIQSPWLSKLPTTFMEDSADKAQFIFNKKFQPLLPKADESIEQWVESFRLMTQQTVLLFFLTLKITLIKLCVLMTSIPLMLLASTAGFVDGLNQRAIRTASLGRESSYVFHQLNRYGQKILKTTLGCWFALPWPVKPAVVFIPVSLLLGLMVSMTASRFKKYL